MILSPLAAVTNDTAFSIDQHTSDVNFPIKLTFSKAADISQPSDSVIFVDAAKLQFPLLLRKWNEGDVFQPAGMNGQSKKVAKFFKDEKRSLIEKENAWLLCSENQIVWIVGQRQDERFRATNDTKEILQITIQK